MAITRFFKMTPEQVDGYHAALIPDGDVLPLDILRNSKEVYRDNEKVIVQALLDSRLLSDIQAATDVDPLTVEGIQTLGIAGSYCGEEYSDRPLFGLFSYFPELAGTKVVGQDEEGRDIVVHKVLRHSWE